MSKKSKRKPSGFAAYMLPRWWILLMALIGWIIVPGPILAHFYSPLFELIPICILGAGVLYMLLGIFIAAWRNPEAYD